MKKVIFACSFLTVFAACSNKPKIAEMKFDTEIVKVDTIMQGEVIDTAFVFTNSGNTDLIIKSAKATCGCTVADYPKEPVAPGEKGVIKAKFRSAGKSGNTKKTVIIEANTKKPFTHLKIETFIKAPKASIAAGANQSNARPKNNLKSKILKPLK